MNIEKYVERQAQIEANLSKGTPAPSAPNISTATAELSAATSAYKQDADEYNRARLNQAMAVIRDLRVRRGRFAALWLAEAAALRANFTTGERWA